MMHRQANNGGDEPTFGGKIQAPAARVADEAVKYLSRPDLKIGAIYLRALQEFGE